MKHILNSLKQFNPIQVKHNNEIVGILTTGYNNLEVLQAIPDNTVDMIYQDPPYYTQKKWEKNGWSFDDSFKSKWHYLFFLAQRLIEEKRILRTRHYQLIENVLHEDGKIPTYQPRIDKILEDYSSKGKKKKLEKGVDVGGSVFVHVDYRANSEIKSYLMDPLFGETDDCLQWNEVQALFNIKLGEKVKTPTSISPVEIEQGPDVVLDPFAGSHSLAAAAWRSGRRFISIEMNTSEELFWKQIEGMEYGCERKD